MGDITKTDEVLTPAETAEILRITKRTLQNFRDPNKKTCGPPWARVGGKIRYLRSEIERYLAEGGDSL